MFPLFLDLSGRLVVVIGGGAVGRRKAAAALDAGAHVRLVSLETRPGEMDDPSLNWLTEPYAVAHLDGAALVFAAATAEVNRRVVHDAAAAGIWVNTATEPDEGDFIVPAVVRRGEFTVAVGTGGAAPQLAQAVRDRLAEQFDDAFGTWVALLAELRPTILTRVIDPEKRREVFERLARWEWLDRLRSESVTVVRLAMWADAGLGNV